jgi:CO/xanthine dehydrogenase FAD-binding subunit
MMPVTVKTFATPTEAAAALSDRSARYIGGGTLVMRALNEGDVSIGTIVRLDDRLLTQIRASGARMTIGAGVTLSQILRERELSFLHTPARLIGGPAVRTTATVGGNLFAPAPYGDLAVALLALDATVSVMSGYGARDIALEEFLASRDRSPGALVLSVTCDRPSAPEAFRFRKVARVKPKGVSVLSIAASLPAVGGRVANPRIAYGAMAPTAIRAKAAERALEGKTLDEPGVAGAVAAAAEGTSPATDAIASAWYRREVVGVHLRRLLLGQAG